MELTVFHYNNEHYQIMRDVTFTDKDGNEHVIDIAEIDLWDAIKDAVERGQEDETYIDNLFSFYVPAWVLGRADIDIAKYLHDNYF